MQDSASISIRQVEWSTHSHLLLEVRTEVFVKEQKVPEELEKDEWDEVSKHWLAVDVDGSPVATARLLPNGRIGRVAVLLSHRETGIGRMIMEALLKEAASADVNELLLHSQVQCSGFYERLGFVRVDGEFEEAGIPHITMKRVIGY